MVIVRLVLQPPLCGISCRQILGMRRLLEILKLFGVLLYYILFVQRL